MISIRLWATVRTLDVADPRRPRAPESRPLGEDQRGVQGQDAEREVGPRRGHVLGASAAPW